MGEFGAVSVISGNIIGQTQTLTLGVYEQLSASFDTAIAIGVLLVVLSATVLITYKVLSAWRPSASTSL